jgi:uncharacterized phage-associated protein
MATIFDVARFITDELGEMTAMKLQKLMYYAQAWNLVWEEEPLFETDFQAWANGPVIPELYAVHRGRFKVDASLFEAGNSNALSERQQANVRKVLGFYGTKTAQWLSNVSHQENPWKAAREGFAPGALCSVVIPKAAIHEYYSAL